MKPQLEPSNLKHRIIFLILVIILTAFGVGGSTYYVLDKQSDEKQKIIEKLEEEVKQEKAEEKKTEEKEEKKDDENEKEAEPKKQVADEVKITKGFLEGSLTYPSSQIPESLVVYAENIANGQIYSTDQKIMDSKYTFGVGYKVEVPEGNYYVYAKEDNITGKAYHNKFITCGMTVSCTDLTKITVQVIAGQITKDITVGDWWNL